MQDQIKNPSGSRSFSTSARAGQDIQQNNIPDSDAVSDEQSAALVANMISDVTEQVTELQGLKYPAPESLPSTENHRERYDAVLNTFTHLLMSDGKLARAQRVSFL